MQQLSSKRPSLTAIFGRNSSSTHIKVSILQETELNSSRTCESETFTQIWCPFYKRKYFSYGIIEKVQLFLLSSKAYFGVPESKKWNKRRMRAPLLKPFGDGKQSHFSWGLMLTYLHILYEKALSSYSWHSACPIGEYTSKQLNFKHVRQSTLVWFLKMKAQ